MDKKMFFVYNPKAGKGQIRSRLAEILDIFTGGGYEVIVYPTRRKQDACEKVMEYADRVDTIVCSGGDGTLDEVVNGLMTVGSEIPLGYLPAGSTNDFAASLFFPKSILDCAEMIMEGNVYRCDIGRFNSSTFAYIAAFGLFTDVAYQTPQDLKNILGHAAYLLEGAKRLLDIRHFHMKIQTDDRFIEDDFIYGMVTNSRTVGGFQHLTGKNVDMDDGLFEVTLIVWPKNPLELQEILTALATAEDNTDYVHSFKTKKLEILSEEEVPWTLDGEFGGNHRNVEIENHHKALQLLLTSTKDEERGEK